jgi:hypothetical protein
MYATHTAVSAAALSCVDSAPTNAIHAACCGTIALVDTGSTGFDSKRVLQKPREHNTAVLAACSRSGCGWSNRQNLTLVRVVTLDPFWFESVLFNFVVGIFDTVSRSSKTIRRRCVCPGPRMSVCFPSFRHFRLHLVMALTPREQSPTYRIVENVTNYRTPSACTELTLPQFC